MPFPRLSAALVAAVVLALVAPASAVEMRVGGLPTVYSGYLVRAYGECIAPNDVARDGIPACSPVVTATCPWHDTHRFEVTQPTIVDSPLGRLFIDRFDHGTTPPECKGYFYEAVTRASGDFDDPDTLPCPSGHCTFQDWPGDHDTGAGFFDTSRLPPLIPPQFTQPLNPNREFLSVRAGIDDQTLATTGLEPAIGATTIYANLTVPYAQCTQPIGSACDIGPWDAACDFESGSVTWEQPDDTTPPSVHVKLKNVAGSSPLCTTGTYHLETTVRMTFAACDDYFAPTPCTLVDQTYALPFVATGRKVDASVTLPLGDFRFNDRLTNTQILSMRLLDPTGAVVAVPGQGTTTGLDNLQVLIDGGALRLKATMPTAPEEAIDPTELDGFTLTITDRNGVVYTVHVPPVRWQLQTPIGSAWTYDDPGGVLGGLTRARIKRMGGPGKTKGYKFDVRAAGVDFSALDFPSVTVTIAVDDAFSLLPAEAHGHRTCLVKGAKSICK